MSDAYRNAARIDQLCDEFEELLGRGESPQLQDFICRVDDSNRGMLGAELKAIMHEHARSLASVGLRPSTDLSDEDPKTIGQYRVLGIIGEGAFGRVYMGHDEDLGRNVAIKLPRTSVLPERLASFLTEARLAASLDHPSIVPVFGLGHTTAGTPYIVSRYVPGGDLRKNFSDAEWTIPRSVTVAIAIAQALDYAHMNGIVHRDIKPANILLDYSGNAFLGDFGTAFEEHDFARGRFLIGTASYMSPEQAACDAQLVDRRSDVFSLGVVLYELLTGVRPFGDSPTNLDVNQRLNAFVHPPREVNPSIPLELQEICIKCLQQQPSDRYATADELATDLSNLRLETSGERDPRSRNSHHGQVRRDRSPNLTADDIFQRYNSGSELFDSAAAELDTRV